MSGADRPEVISGSKASSSHWDADERGAVGNCGEEAGRDHHQDGGDQSVQPGGKNLLLGATRLRLLAHPGHAAPRPQRVRPSVRWMNWTSADRGWKDRALPAASAMIGDAPGAKLIR